MAGEYCGGDGLGLGYGVGLESGGAGRDTAGAVEDVRIPTLCVLSTAHPLSILPTAHLPNLHPRRLLYGPRSSGKDPAL